MSKPMHTYIWKTGRFLAVAQASDQFEARKMLLQEFTDKGAPKEFSDRVVEKAPEIFHRAVADFVRTDSYELEQADAEVKRLQSVIETIATMCFEAGASSEDGTATAAVRDLIRKLEAPPPITAERLSHLLDDHGLQPTFYVQHPDGSFSVADPQPNAETRAIFAKQMVRYWQAELEAAQ